MEETYLPFLSFPFSPICKNAEFWAIPRVSRSHLIQDNLSTDGEAGFIKILPEFSVYFIVACFVINIIFKTILKQNICLNCLVKMSFEVVRTLSK